MRTKYSTRAHILSILALSVVSNVAIQSLAQEQKAKPTTDSLNFNTANSNSQGKAARQESLKQSYDYSSQIDYQFALVNAFLEGFKATTFSPNIYSCSQDLQQTANSFNNSYISLNANNQTPMLNETLFTYSEIISTDGADAVGNCYQSGYSFYSYGRNLYSQFDQPADIMPSFLQNLLGNAILFQKISNAIVLAQKANNTELVWQQIGRLCYAIVSFTPITTSSLYDDLADLPLKPDVQIKSDPYLDSLYRKQHYPNLEQQSINISDYQQYIEDAKAFSFQLFNTTIGVESLNFSICIGNVSILQDSVDLIQKQYQLQFYDQIGRTLTTIFKTANPLTESCYVGVSEIGGILMGYLRTAINFDMLFFNIIHYSGSIYDNVTAIVDIIRYGDYYSEQYWKYLGFYVGTLINEVYYVPVDFKPFPMPTNNSTNSTADTSKLAELDIPLRNF